MFVFKQLLIYTLDQVHRIWTPISFTDNWLSCDTSILSDIEDSWFSRRLKLVEKSKDYEKFILRLKREHAIETGVIENIYDLGKGVTETFIKEGFFKSYLSHGDTNIDENDLINHLNDHLDSVNFVFDIVKENRPLSVGFIKELHHLVTRNQRTAEGRDQFGRKFQIPLLKGKYKERENNPTSSSGVKMLYCPPEHVSSEMDKLIRIYEKLIIENINPLVISSWFHHSFTTIHPFQDGNGRVARLLTSLIFIKNNFFPFTVLREEAKVKYISALEKADSGEPQDLVTYFGYTQRRNIEKALNIRDINEDSLNEVQNILVRKIEEQRFETDKKRNLKIEDIRNRVYDYCLNKVEEISNDLKNQLNGNANVNTESKSFNQNGGRSLDYEQRIVDFSNANDYFYNRNYPYSVIRFSIELKNKRLYHLNIFIHHYGYDNSTIAIGSVLEFQKPNSKGLDLLPQVENVYPHIVSIINNNIGGKLKNIGEYVEKVFSKYMSIIASEL